MTIGFLNIFLDIYPKFKKNLEYINLNNDIKENIASFYSIDLAFEKEKHYLSINQLDNLNNNAKCHICTNSSDNEKSPLWFNFDLNSDKDEEYDYDGDDDDTDDNEDILNDIYENCPTCKEIINKGDNRDNSILYRILTDTNKNCISYCNFRKITLEEKKSLAKFYKDNNLELYLPNIFYSNENIKFYNNKGIDKNELDEFSRYLIDLYEIDNLTLNIKYLQHINIDKNVKLLIGKNNIKIKIK